MGGWALISCKISFAVLDAHLLIAQARDAFSVVWNGLPVGVFWLAGFAFGYGTPF